MQTPPRVALFTPLPPSRTGTADYAAELIESLGNHVNLEVLAEIPRRFRPSDFDLLLYQIANNPYHKPFYDAALRWPGIVTLHETNLNHLLRGEGEASYLREVAYEVLGRDGELPMEDLSVLGEPEPHQLPLLRRLLDSSRACIVHSRHALLDVQRRGFARPVAIIPHGARVDRFDPSECRKRFGIPPNIPLVGLFGYQRPDKKVAESLEVFRRLKGAVPEAMLLVAGESHPEIPIEEEARNAGLTGAVVFAGFQESTRELETALAACDIVLNLRRFSYGETSGTTLRAFGLAKAVVVSDDGSNREFPEEICVRIPADGFEEEVAFRCMERLIREPEITRELGAAAQQWVAQTCTWESAARLHARFFDEVLAAGKEDGKVPAPSGGAAPAGSGKPRRPIRECLASWVQPDSDAARYHSSHENRLVRTVELIPPAEAGGRALEMGCYLQVTPLLRSLYGYQEVRGCYLGAAGFSERRQTISREGEVFGCSIDLFDAERDSFPYPGEHFDLVLCCELLEHLQHDPMWMLLGIHRVLKPGGTLILTTPNAVSLRAIEAMLRGNHPALYSRFPRPREQRSEDPRHAREYTPGELAQLLFESGFVVSHLETAAYSPVQARPEGQWLEAFLRKHKFQDSLRGDCIFAVARRVSELKDRYPVWLYDEA